MLIKRCAEEPMLDSNAPTPRIAREPDSACGVTCDAGSFLFGFRAREGLCSFGFLMPTNATASILKPESCGASTLQGRSGALQGRSSLLLGRSAAPNLGALLLISLPRSGRFSSLRPTTRRAGFLHRADHAHARNRVTLEPLDHMRQVKKSGSALDDAMKVLPSSSMSIS